MEIYDVTDLSSIGLSFIIVMVILVLFLPRRLAFIPIIITACYITLAQQILITVFHFSAMRLVILFGWIRLILRGEIVALKLNTIDKTIICWVISSFVVYNLQWQTSEAFVNRLGLAFNAIGIYFLFRYYIRDISGYEHILVTLSVVIVPLAIAMMYEHLSGRNIFAIFGGVPEETIIRGERLRCQGPFRHPILAGTFGAFLAPILFVLWFKGGIFKLLAMAGVISATTITVLSASFGPLTAYISGVVGLSMWSLRRHMRKIRWGIVFTLITLHIVMKAPVWYLMSRMSGLTGGTGWHRSYLIDQAIAHFGEWWLLGVKYTGDWFPYALDKDATQADITNQYILEGVTGGLITMILFIIVIISCFRIVGLSLKAAEENTFAEKIVLWSLGASLFVHVISFLSVPYFDQIIVFWYLLLAMISAIGGALNVQNGIRTIANGGKPAL